jgi:hypothetical protein
MRTTVEEEKQGGKGSVMNGRGAGMKSYRSKRGVRGLNAAVGGQEPGKADGAGMRGDEARTRSIRGAAGRTERGRWQRDDRGPPNRASTSHSFL